MRRGGLDYLGVINAVRMGDEGGGGGGKEEEGKVSSTCSGDKGEGQQTSDISMR